jgi:hypothetical protein
VAHLLNSLPGLLDNAPADQASGAPLINDLVVRFEAKPEAGIPALVAKDIRQWPAFDLFLDSEEKEEAGETIVSTFSVNAQRPPVRLSALVYELLGGPLRETELMAGRYSPLAPLGEKGNLFLQKALKTKPYSDCQSFWTAFRKSIDAPAIQAAPPPPPVVDESPVTIAPTVTPAPPRPAAPAWTIPPTLLTQAQLADILELKPLDALAGPTRVVARARFRIGRSRRMSDFATKLVDDRAPGGERMVEISRVHVLGERTPEGIGFRDGNGDRPSSNGSSWNDASLTAGKPTSVNAMGIIALSPSGCRYSIGVVPLVSRPFAETQIANLANWAGNNPPVATPPPLPIAGVAFRPPAGATITRQAFWLLSGAGLEILPNGEIIWSDDEAPSQAILHRAGSFWVVRLSNASVVKVGGTTLATGEVAPLAAGQELQLGAVRFAVSVVQE